MKNPAEELVTAWVQECKHYFTMNNIIVPKEKDGKKGGKGAEIDILATNGKKRVWIEVSVSTSPRGIKKAIRFKGTIKNYLSDFKRKDKNKKAKEIFGNKNYEKWCVYGKLPLSKKEMDKFEEEMKKNGVIAIYFENILKELSELKGYRLDSARGYVNLFKTFYN